MVRKVAKPITCHAQQIKAASDTVGKTQPSRNPEISTSQMNTITMAAS